MNIVEQLQAILQQNKNEFIQSIYREILNREPDRDGYRAHTKSLTKGFPKTAVLEAIMRSDEIRRLLSYPAPSKNCNLVIHKLQQMLQLQGGTFITELYTKLLCRVPDPNGLIYHTNRLNHGIAKHTILLDFMFSEEFRTKLLTPVITHHHNPSESLSVHNIGTMFETTGYAAANRHLMLELANLGVNIRFTPHHVEENCVDLNPNSLAMISELRKTILPNKHIVLFCFPAQYFFRDNHYTIGFTMYELSRIPKPWLRKCNQMDEIWVPSSFNYQTFAQSGVDEHKLRVMPLGVNTEIFHSNLNPLPIQNKKRFTFLWTISGSVFDLRKGIDILVPAFLEEFSNKEDVCLVLKSRASTAEQMHKQQEFISQMSVKTSGKISKSIIHLCTLESWSEEKMAQLYNSADCYVFPTRGEGWNLTVMEAMACGIPVITTKWSAHLDYVNQTNGFLIQQKLGRHSDDQFWANPDKHHLRQLMRYVFEHQETAKQKAQQGAKFIQENYTWKACATRVYNRLYEIQQTTK